MKPGRRPKPIGLRVLQGNPGRRPIPKDIPAVEKLYTTPEAPAWLDDYAKEIWKDLALKLTKAGILSELDINILAHYCSAASLCILARKKVDEESMIVTCENKNGTLRAQKNPLISTYRESLEDVIRLSAQLGLSPSERARLHIKKDDDKKDFFKQGILLRQAGRAKGN